MAKEGPVGKPFLIQAERGGLGRSTEAGKGCSDADLLAIELGGLVVIELMRDGHGEAEDVDSKISGLRCQKGLICVFLRREDCGK